MVEGSLPDDVYGHAFFMTPVGWPNGVVPPMDNRPSVINGDGMCVRVDFGSGGATLTSKIVKGPDYWADEATGTVPWYLRPFSRFQNFGLLRGSIRLGTRSFGNTALTPMPDQRDPDGPIRLLACYDAGRPFELDPESLETLSTVGYAREWESQVFAGSPFPTILSTAHPAYDPNTGETFFANYGMSGLTMAATIPLIEAFSQIPLEIQTMLWRFANLFGVEPYEPVFWQRLIQLSGDLVHWIGQLVGVDIPYDFAHVVLWDGENSPRSWKLMLPDGTPARIRESVHQVGVTKDWVILMDTAFKLRLEQFYTNPVPESDVADRFLRGFTATRQIDGARLLFVRRSDLVAGSEKPCDPFNMPKVKVQTVDLPLSSCHFLADYDDSDDRLRIHVAHGSALDIGEWVRSYDQLATTGGLAPAILEGMIASAMDLSRFARYDIRPSSGEVLGHEICSDQPDTWGVALYAGKQVPVWGPPPPRYRHLYWFCSGLWPELMTNFIYQLYADYPDRLAGLQQVLDQGKEGTPSTLLRIDADDETIADVYRFDDGWTLSSPQFLPRRGTDEAAPADDLSDQMDGYILCNVWGPDDVVQLWLFDAANLAEGPVAKLGSDRLQVGFSMHSAWLPRIEPTEGGYRVDVREDTESKLRWKPLLRSIFEKSVYPHFE